MAIEISERVGHAAKNTVTGKTYTVKPAPAKQSKKVEKAAKLSGKKK